MSFREVVEYWRNGAEKDLEAAQSLAKLGHYAHALFFCHLSLEKMLKAVYVARHEKHAPFTHDLEKLLQESGLSFTEETAKECAAITQFNVKARYPDEKSEMYRKYNNRDYAEKYLAITSNLLSWLKESLTQK